MENFIVGFMVYIIGVVFSYIFVFYFKCTNFKTYFIGFSNMQNDFIFKSKYEINSLITYFYFFMIPFLSAILIPVWKVAVLDSTKSMK